MFRDKTFCSVLILSAVLAGGGARADDSFTARNPATGQTESVWAATAPGGSSSEVFFSILEGTGWTPSEALTSSGSPDQNPHLCFSPGGDRRVVWWNDGAVDTVLLASRDASSAGWSAPVTVSDGVEDARHPQAAVFGAATYIAYEGVSGADPRKIIVGKWDDPGPIPLTLVGVASQSSSLSVRIHSDGGHLWIDWVDSPTLLGWSEQVAGAWSSVLYEPYAGPADLGPGRGRIRKLVQGN